MTDNKMNPEVKQLWIEALESDRYKQGKYQLRRDDAYCCLGVLCEVAVSAEIIPPAVAFENEEYTEYTFDGHSAFLPAKVEGWAGLSRVTYLDNNVTCLVSAMNDTECRTFQEIADFVRENL